MYDTANKVVTQAATTRKIVVLPLTFASGGFIYYC